MPPSPRAACLAVPLTLLVAGTGCSDYRDCSDVDTSGVESLPVAFTDAGLYAAADVVVDGAVEFEPRFPLWTDGASKRRWLVLPEGEQVDTSDPEAWVFPIGTRFFKEFTRDGVRVETRLNLRTDAGWAAASYLWNEDGSEALRQLESVTDAGGTDHDVPSAAECLACHGGRGNFSLGFSATQLSAQVRASLFDAGVLSAPVQLDLDLPPVAREALGALHGNCSHCHNATRDEQPQATTCYVPPQGEDDDPLDFTLPADLASVEDAPALQTGRWLLGEPGDSDVLDRMSRRDPASANPSMPPLGTELVDAEGLAAVEAFVAELPPRGR